MGDLSNEVLRTTQNKTGTPQSILVVLNPIANNKKAENLVFMFKSMFWKFFN